MTWTPEFALEGFVREFHPNDEQRDRAYALFCELDDLPSAVKLDEEVLMPPDRARVLDALAEIIVEIRTSTIPLA